MSLNFWISDIWQKSKYLTFWAFKSDYMHFLSEPNPTGDQLSEDIRIRLLGIRSITTQVINLLPTSLKNFRTFHSGTPNFAHKNSIRSWIWPVDSMVLVLWLVWNSWKMPIKMTSNLIILKYQPKVYLQLQAHWLFILLAQLYS